MNIWFVTVVFGQFIFALYILGFYGVHGIAGDFERWNSGAPHAYIKKDLFGNILFGLHMALAAVITIGGPLQLMKKIRNRFPKFHRINGRVYIISAFLISAAGMYLTWARGIIGGFIGHVFITINGIIIMVCAFYTIKKAMDYDLKKHRKWALRLFLAVSGVWFFRVFLMFWLTINQGPVGFDMNTFMGPALNILYSLSYICPILFLEFYFRAKQSNKSLGKWSLATFILIGTCCIAIGTFAATMGMWLPSI